MLISAFAKAVVTFSEIVQTFPVSVAFRHGVFLCRKNLHFGYYSLKKINPANSLFTVLQHQMSHCSLRGGEGEIIQFSLGMSILSLKNSPTHQSLNSYRGEAISLEQWLNVQLL